MAYTKRTADERKQAAKDLHDTFVQGVEMLRNSDEWAKYLAFTSRFHSYSFTNQVLVYIQCPTATNVAGYQAWRKMGRQVRKGEKGITIFGGRRVVVNEDEDIDEDNKRTRFLSFPVTVFDIVQTDPIDGAIDMTECAPVRLVGDDPEGIYDLVSAHLGEIGASVIRKKIAGQINGYTFEDDEAVKVVIDEDLSPAQSAKTLLHELAHVVLGHLDHAEEYQQHRGRFEVEAESVSWIVASMLGLDSSSYSNGYVASWMENASSDVLKETAETVVQTSRQIVDDLIPSDTPVADLVA